MAVQPAEKGQGRDAPIPQHQHQLDESRNAGGRQRVADIGLDRPQNPPPVVTGEGLAQRLHFDRIAEARARAVQFHIPDGRRIDFKTIMHHPQ